MTRPKRTAPLKATRSRRGPLALFLAALLLLAAGGAAIISLRGCPRLKPPAAAGPR